MVCWAKKTKKKRCSAVDEISVFIVYPFKSPAISSSKPDKMISTG